MTAERYLQDLSKVYKAYKETEGEFNFHAALIDYMLGYGLEKVIKPVTTGDLTAFIKGRQSSVWGTGRA